MKTLIATDVNIFFCDNRYYFASQVSTILKRYYDAFGKLFICSRRIVVNEIHSSLEDVTNIIENVVDISTLERTMIGNFDKQIYDAVEQCDLVICRCPGIISFRAANVARKLKKPYFAESMGCAWDAYWNHGIVGKLIAPYMFFKMKHTVYNADYALYVTNAFLQSRYPCKNATIAASNVKIDTVSEDVLLDRHRKIMKMDFHNITLVTTAAVDVRYKGQEYVIRSIPALNERGIRVKYVLIGDGDKTFLEKLAQHLKVQDQIEFVGRKSLEEIFDIIDKAHIYIQPSLQEGLPRSVIEAMSRGCHCIGAKTAGIPELIEEEFIVRRRNVSDIVDKVFAYVSMSVQEKLDNSSKIFMKSKQYLGCVIDERRNAYFEKIKKDIE